MKKKKPRHCKKCGRMLARSKTNKSGFCSNCYMRNSEEKRRKSKSEPTKLKEKEK